MNSRLGLLGFLLGLMVLTALLAGCSGSAASPSPSPLSAQQLVSNASDKLQALNSYHFTLDQVGGGTPITMGIEMKKAEGDVLNAEIFIL